MRELNRLGVTSAIDAGGGFQNYPDDYQVIEDLHQRRRADRPHRLQPVHAAAQAGEATTSRSGSRWPTPGEGDDFYRMNGAGEMLVYSAADFEDFLEPRPDLPPDDGGASLTRGRAHPGREPLAVPPARHLRRDDRPLPRRLRGGEPGRAVRRPALVLRPRRDDLASGTSSGSRRSAAASPCSTAWPTRASTSSTATATRPREHTPPDRRRMLSMGVPVGAGHRRAPASPATTRGSSLVLARQRARRSAARALYPEANRLDRDGRRCGVYDRGQRLVLRRGGQEGVDRGRPARRPRRAVGATTSQFPKRRSRASSRC